MNSILKLAAIGATCAAFGVAASPAYGGAKQSCKDSKKAKSAKQCVQGSKAKGRSLASLSTRVEPLGQGEVMLNSLTSTEPRFLSANARGETSVRLAGVCRDTAGVLYHTGERGYSACLDAQTSSTGSPSEYFQSQRQAGVGILVGK